MIRFDYFINKLSAMSVAILLGVSLTCCSDDVEIAIVSGKGNTTVSIAFPGPATGTLTVTVDGKEYSQEVVDGKAAVSITGLGEVLII